MLASLPFFFTVFWEGSQQCEGERRGRRTDGSTHQRRVPKLLGARKWSTLPKQTMKIKKKKFFIKHREIFFIQAKQLFPDAEKPAQRPLFDPSVKVRIESFKDLKMCVCGALRKPFMWSNLDVLYNTQFLGLRNLSSHIKDSGRIEASAGRNVTFPGGFVTVSWLSLVFKMFLKVFCRPPHAHNEHLWQNILVHLSHSVMAVRCSSLINESILILPILIRKMLYIFWDLNSKSFLAQHD